MAHERQPEQHGCPRPLESRIPHPLWSHWGTLVALVGLLGIFWTGRKLNGAF
jgi:hypothetical protein